LPAPLPIVATKRNAIVIPELELGDVTMQMLLGAVLVNPLHAALDRASLNYRSKPFA
jgi:hypothetical protein